MNYDITDPRGQLPSELYNHLLNRVKRDLLNAECRRHQRALAARPAPPRSPEAEAALRKYWGDLRKEQFEALEKEWANVPEFNPILSEQESSNGN